MLGYAYYISAVDNVIVGVSKFVQGKSIDKSDKDAILASCQATVAGIQKVYAVFRTGYTDAQAGTMPKFSPDTPTAPISPGPPLLPGSYVPWFQNNWKGINAVLQAVGPKSPDLVPLIPTLTSAGDQLLGQLNKSFPPSKLEEASVKEDLPSPSEAVFPALKSLQ